MKLLVLCLVAVLGCRAAPTDKVMRKLRQVQTELGIVNATLQDSNMTLNAPPEDDMYNSCVSALACFHNATQVHFDMTNIEQGKLSRSLNHNFTIEGMKACNAGSDTIPCETKVGIKEFLKRLNNLIQKAFTIRSKERR